MESPLTNDLPEVDDGLKDADLAEIERKTLDIGRYLFEHLQVERPRVYQRRWWDDRIMAWAMKDEALKVELFRFVDVLPMLNSNDKVVRHLDEYLTDVRDRLPMAARVALGLARRTPITRAALARTAKLSARDFARRFIAGTNTREVLAAAQRERKQQRGFTLDILGEAVASQVEAERFFQAYVDLIENVAPTVNDWPEVPQIDRDAQGELPRMNLSVKLSALDSQFDAIDPAGTLKRAGMRLRELLRVARRNKAFINVDMESYDKKDLTLSIFKQVLIEDEFRDVGDVGIVIQCYLKDAGRDLIDLRDWAQRRGKPVWVRLVKGAYWDYETIHAREMGWPVPVYQQKWQSDVEFERQTRFLMSNYQHLRPALGSHNIRSIAHAIAVAEHLELPDGGFELQMLYGMADAEKQALVDRGHRMRIYMPYGELIPGMAYLVRRLLENTSNDSFLRAGFIEHRSPDDLLKNPSEIGKQSSLPLPLGEGRGEGESSPSSVMSKELPKEESPHAPPKGERIKPSPHENEQTDMSTATIERSLDATFHNQPLVDFALQSNRQAMADALDKVRGNLGRHWPLVIAGENVETDRRMMSYDPCQKDRVVGVVSSADVSHAETAVAAARNALPAWSALGAEKRARFLRSAAEAMRMRFFELAAWQVYECGKQWREATGDVCEAIDFCEYYADGAIEMERPHGADVPGEENRFEYIPRGVTAVIAPWNFPLAILTGMTAAALATGNTVVMKPAEQSPVVAALLMEIFQGLDLPPGVLNYLPGVGETVGAALVQHKDVALIAFTGSREVGLAINRKAAEVSASGIGMVKRVIAEMGGKNAVIVDSDADLDEAVLGVAHSAFGYQGQKCSACSRAIVLDDVYDAFLSRLIEAARSLKVAAAEDPAAGVSAVIDEVAYKRIKQYIDLGRREGREVLTVDADELAQQGHYIGPHIFADVPRDARIAQEEIFGPVLAVIRADDLEVALQIANDTPYALTGGIFSRSPANLARVRREFLVGNLYLNRGTTGALVGRQPFGGFKMSGIGSKAGGGDYLLQFVLPRCITENTMRRGFAPPDE